jgi:biopolymer transport protein ExbB/TolQ
LEELQVPLVIGTLWEYVSQGGVMMAPLVILSVLALIFIIERAITYYRVKGDTAEIFSEGDGKCRLA